MDYELWMAELCEFCESWNNTTITSRVSTCLVFRVSFLYTPWPLHTYFFIIRAMQPPHRIVQTTALRSKSLAATYKPADKNLNATLRGNIALAHAVLCPPSSPTSSSSPRSPAAPPHADQCLECRLTPKQQPTGSSYMGRQSCATCVARACSSLLASWVVGAWKECCFARQLREKKRTHS